MGSLTRAFDRERSGARIHGLIRDALPIQASITGQGLRDLLGMVAEIIPQVEIKEVPTGTSAFDWTVPLEWNVRAGYVEDPTGKRVVDVANHPLHLVSYSEPINAKIDLDNLKDHLHSLPDQPRAIPYRTSYYERDWGFCLAHEQLISLDPGQYRVVIDSTLEEGVLNYGEAYLPGTLSDEILLTAHVGHPGQANDNLSGIGVAAEVASMLSRIETKYSYRILWIPGGIGSLVWLSRNPEAAGRVRHGLTLACLGDNAGFTYKSTFTGTAPIDLAARAALGGDGSYVAFEPYGFDERNFNSPGFRMDIGSLTRSPHGGYPEYHSSLDSLDLVSPGNLAESAEITLRILERLEEGTRYMTTNPEGEPQLGKRGLYGSVGGLKERAQFEMAMLWLLSCSDGRYSDLDVSQLAGIELDSIRAAASALSEAGLLNPIG